LGVFKGILLGHIVSVNRKEPDPKKIAIIAKLPPPTTVTGVRSALGHFGFYRDCMEDYASMALPLNTLTKKDVKFEWTDKCQQSFDQLKQRLISHPVLTPPDWNKSFHVYCDASSVAVGSALCQIAEDTQRDHLIAFASKQLTHAERNYTTTERECLSMIFSVKKYRHYLLMNPMVFYVDHMAIKFLVNKPNLSGRLARWVLLLSKFDYTVEYKPGKTQLQADHLSRLSEDLGHSKIDDELPDAQLFAVRKGVQAR
jgi:hypothetical protein